MLIPKWYFKQRASNRFALQDRDKFNALHFKASSMSSNFSNRRTPYHGMGLEVHLQSTSWPPNFNFGCLFVCLCASNCQRSCQLTNLKGCVQERIEAYSPTNDDHPTVPTHDQFKLKFKLKRDPRVNHKMRKFSRRPGYLPYQPFVFIFYQ